QVYLDGTLKATVDTYAPAEQAQAAGGVEGGLRLLRRGVRIDRRLQGPVEVDLCDPRPGTFESDPGHSRSAEGQRGRTARIGRLDDGAAAQIAAGLGIPRSGVGHGWAGLLDARRATAAR